MTKRIPEVPSEFMSRIAHSTRAMDGFFSLDEDRQEALAQYLSSAGDDETGKSRIEEVTEVLEKHSERHDCQ